MSIESAHQVLSRYALNSPLQVTPLGNAGGFSGAEFWQVNAGADPYILRRWPAQHPSLQQLHQIHRVLWHARVNDLDVVAYPIKTRTDETVVVSDGHLWELSEKKPGRADFLEHPSDERLRDALKLLARFHQSAAQVNIDLGPSQTLQARVQFFRQVPQKIQSLRRVVGRPLTATLNMLRQCLFQTWDRGLRKQLPQLVEEMMSVETQVFPLQPVIRDVWHDHLLFSGERVTGLVDFGAMQMDTIAVDLARLVGSLVPDDPGRWMDAFAWYDEIRPVSDAERTVARLLDRTGVIGAAVNWLYWTQIEGRLFESEDAVDNRVRTLLSRLQCWR